MTNCEANFIELSLRCRGKTRKIDRMCKIPSVWLHLVEKARLTQGLSWSCCRLSVVGLQSSLRATHGLPPQRHWRTVGVLARTHQCATESRMTLWQSANPFLCWLECGVVVSVVVVVFRAHLQLRILTLLLDWKPCSSSLIPADTIEFNPKFRRVVVVSSNEFLD